MLGQLLRLSGNLHKITMNKWSNIGTLIYLTFILPLHKSII